MTSAAPPPGAPAPGGERATARGDAAGSGGGAAEVRGDAAELVVRGPRLALRYATPADAPRLLELASDPLVTRFFSWGPYTSIEQPDAYIASLPARRAAGDLLEFVIVDGEDTPIGVTGLSELARRDRRATVGSWLGRAAWGTGANFESKAMVAALAFEHLGVGRLTAWANTRNGRSQRALERVGFRREGVLRAWHRHGDEMHDVVIFALLRAAWEDSALRAVAVTVEGAPPPAFVLA
ncbi:MAG TPA: GNAT family protein [Solirubrobacter sp.]|nr:GNAT family protein [Solirubrobacter sp.]